MVRATRTAGRAPPSRAFTETEPQAPHRGASGAPAPVQDCRTCPIGVAAVGRCPFTPIRVPAASVLCAQGERQGNAYFVRDGLLALRTVDAEGSESWLALRGPRTMLFPNTQQQPSPCELRTVTEARLCSAPAEPLAAWMGPPGSPQRTLLELLLSELERHRRELSWRSGESDSRLARFLLASCEGGEQRALPPKQLVARALGMRPETLSRCLRRFIDRGLVTEQPSLRVLDREGLNAVACGGEKAGRAPA
ncbi:Crp/Fnr family transcriptional regulator [Myxococcaceae bacterium GXIMD 01537]